MARSLDIDFNSTRQIVAALRIDLTNLALFYRTLPAPGSLRIFAARALDRLGGSRQHAPLLVAIDELLTLIALAGGSYTKFRNRLTSTLNAQDTAGLEAHGIEHRRGLLKHATAIMGHRAECIINMMILKPRPTDPTKIDSILVTGVVGLLTHGMPTPLVFNSINVADSQLTGDALSIRPLSGHPHALIEHFSSPDIAGLSYQRRPGGTRDVVYLPEAQRFDVVMALQKGPDVNRKLDGGVSAHMAFIRRPSRRLILDTYLHTSLANGFRSQVRAYSWHPGFQYDPVLDRDDELPDNPRLELLGTGIRNAAADSWARHAALTAHIFELAGWDPNEFIGYRCHHLMPIWQAGYVMSFDYRSAEHPAP